MTKTLIRTIPCERYEMQKKQMRNVNPSVDRKNKVLIMGLYFRAGAKQFYCRKIEFQVRLDFRGGQTRFGGHVSTQFIFALV